MVVKRRKRNGWARRRESGGYSQCESPSGNGNSTSLVERKWLLPPASTRRSTLLRQLGIGRSQLRAREIRNRSLFGTIEKVRAEDLIILAVGDKINYNKIIIL